MRCKFRDGVHVSRYYDFDLPHFLEGYSDLIVYDWSEKLKFNKCNAGLLSYVQIPFSSSNLLFEEDFILFFLLLLVNLSNLCEVY